MKVVGTGTQDSYAMWFESGALRSGANLSSPDGATSFPFVPVDGNWHHMATSFEHASGTTTLYLDGAPVSCSSNPTTILYDAHPVLIGADVDN